MTDRRRDNFFLKIKIFFPLIIIICSLFIYYLSSYSNFGVTMDEPRYIERSVSYNNFFSSFFNPPHEDFLKLSAVNKYLWHKHYLPYKLSLTSVFRAFLLLFFSDALFAVRLSTAAIFLLLLFYCYKFVLKETYSPFCASLSCVFLILTPRFFAHTHFGALDIFTAAFWFITSYYFYNYLVYDKDSVKFAVFFGLSLQVRIHNIFLVPVFFVTAVFFRKYSTRKKIIKIIILTACAAPLIFFILDPWLWDSPVEKLAQKIGFYTQRTDEFLMYSYYFGKYYVHIPPASYVFVMIFITTPSVILFLFLYGAYKMKNKFYAFCFINLISGLLIYSLPLPKHDGVRLFLYAFPFMAVIAALGLKTFSQDAARLIKINPLLSKITVAAAVIFILMYNIVGYYPYLTSYYGAVIGGVKGAEKYGFDITYWQDSFNADTLNFINKNVPENSKVVLWPFDVKTTEFYSDRKAFREDLEFYDIYKAAESGGKYHIFYYNRKSFLTRGNKDFFDYLFETKKIRIINEIKNVPLVVYFGEVDFDSYKRQI